MPSTYSYREYSNVLKKDAEVVDIAVKVIRETVKLHGPKAVQAEISSLIRQPVDRGGYKRAFRFEDIPGGATAYNFSPYASIIEHGRRPGAKGPPLQVIIAWLARKRIAKGTGSRNFATESQYARLRSIAYVIARAIKRRGLPALLILEHASKTIDLEVKRALDEMLRIGA